MIAASFLIGAIAFVGFTLSPTVSYAAEGDNPRPNDGIVGCVEAGDTGEAASTRATTEALGFAMCVESNPSEYRAQNSR